MEGKKPERNIEFEDGSKITTWMPFVLSDRIYGFSQHFLLLFIDLFSSCNECKKLLLLRNEMIYRCQNTVECRRKEFDLWIEYFNEGFTFKNSPWRFFRQDSSKNLFWETL